MKATKFVGIGMAWTISLVSVGLWAQGSGTSSQAVAQANARVSGTVQDSQGGAIPGARVVLINEARGTRTAPSVTNAVGTFVFPDVAPDVYTVEATMPGFRTLRRPGVTVSAGSPVNVPILVMEVASQQTRTIRPGEAMGPVIAGEDIGFQPVFSANTPPGAVAGRWMVRVNGEWRVATSAMQTVPIR
jgi:hypothetical protein